MVISLSISCLVPHILHHSSLLSPMPRNAVDRDLQPWSGGRFGDNQSCAHPSYESQHNNATRERFGLCWGCNCVNGTAPCEAAQTCLYFSQGCSVRGRLYIAFFFVIWEILYTLF